MVPHGLNLKTCVATKSYDRLRYQICAQTTMQWINMKMYNLTCVLHLMLGKTAHNNKLIVSNFYHFHVITFPFLSSNVYSILTTRVPLAVILLRGTRPLVNIFAFPSHPINKMFFNPKNGHGITGDTDVTNIMTYCAVELILIQNNYTSISMSSNSSSMGILCLGSFLYKEQSETI